jgi:hypothetical protein
MGSSGRILRGRFGDGGAAGGSDCGDFNAGAAEGTEKERINGSAEF